MSLVCVSEIPCLIVWVSELYSLVPRNTCLCLSLSLGNTWFESQTRPCLSPWGTCLEFQEYLFWVSEIPGLHLRNMRFESKKYFVWTSESHSLSLINPWFKIHGLRILYPQDVRNSQNLSYLSLCFSHACIVHEGVLPVLSREVRAFEFRRTGTLSSDAYGEFSLILMRLFTIIISLMDLYDANAGPQLSSLYLTYAEGSMAPHRYRGCMITAKLPTWLKPKDVMISRSVCLWQVWGRI